MADGDDDVPLILTWDNDTNSGLLTDDASERLDESKLYIVISFILLFEVMINTFNRLI